MVPQGISLGLFERLIESLTNLVTIALYADLHVLEFEDVLVTLEHHEHEESLLEEGEVIALLVVGQVDLLGSHIPRCHVAQIAEVHERGVLFIDVVMFELLGEFVLGNGPR